MYDLLPEHLKRKVRDALESEGAVKRCTVCKAEYVMKGVEWIEFWDVIPWEDGSKEVVEYFGPDTMEELLKAVGEEKGVKWNRFLKRYLGRWGEGRANVVPLVREACSWECGEVWMGEREVAEEGSGEGY